MLRRTLQLQKQYSTFLNFKIPLLGDRGMKKIKITLVKSPIDRPERQKQTLKALGLNKANAAKEVEATPQILGMVRKVEHLVKVENV
jgi:large subunit ribosomal protein L30